MCLKRRETKDTTSSMQNKKKKKIVQKVQDPLRGRRGIFSQTSEYNEVQQAEDIYKRQGGLPLGEHRHDIVTYNM